MGKFDPPAPHTSYSGAGDGSGEGGGDGDGGDGEGDVATEAMAAAMAAVKAAEAKEEAAEMETEVGGRRRRRRGRRRRQRRRRAARVGGITSRSEGMTWCGSRDETCGIVWIHRQIVSSDCVSSADSQLDRKCSVTLECLAN